MGIQVTLLLRKVALLLLPALVLAQFQDSAVAQAGAWLNTTPMPTAREKLATCVIGEHIYAIGGSPGANQNALNTTERFDTASHNWSQLAPMPTPRAFLSAAVVDDICYTFGGRLNFGLPGGTTVEAFNPVTGSWSTLAPMPTGRFATASAAIDGKIYVVGGATTDTTVVSTVEVYTPASNSWATLPPLPTARAVTAAAAIGGKLYVFGGTSNPGRQDYNVVETYDPATNQWSTAAPLLVPRSQAAAAVVGDLVYLIAGGRLTQARDNLQIYDPVSNSWSEGSALNDVRVRMAAATVGSVIYAIGGSRTVTPPHPGISSVEYLEVGDGAEPFQINTGLNDAWFNPATPGQGFFVSVFPDIGSVFLAWFTYDTQRPPGSVFATLGEPGHRWLTAFGSYADNLAALNIEVTRGGIFNATTPGPTQVLDGAITLEFHDCNRATLTYDIPSLDLQGQIQIQRIALDNVAACEVFSSP